MPTVRNILMQPLGAIVPLGHTTPGTTSLKAGSAAFPPILQYNFSAGSLPIGNEMQDDQVCLAQTHEESAFTINETIGNEGDTRRLFARMTLPIARALPRVEQRWEVGPIGPTHSPVTVDVRFATTHGCALIGELKRPGIIDPDSWSNKTIQTNKTRIGKELRMYAHTYRCPQVFCFDGVNLLIVRFQAASIDEIRQETCGVSCSLIDCKNGNPIYWLYRVAAEGVRRIQGQTAGAVSLGGSTRHFEYYNGKPFWVTPDGTPHGAKSFDHPGNAVRRLANSGQWVWQFNGQIIIDTPV
ncbi:hypothetical protein FQN50_010037 [Emmonsiellopsis sp. PD_5]|nr:hypothetical protein FQN50_010037 [Emmonsiellopsis sp. PD_5]